MVDRQCKIQSQNYVELQNTSIIADISSKALLQRECRAFTSNINCYMVFTFGSSPTFGTAGKHTTFTPLLMRQTKYQIIFVVRMDPWGENKFYLIKLYQYCAYSHQKATRFQNSQMDLNTNHPLCSMQAIFVCKTGPATKQTSILLLLRPEDFACQQSPSRKSKLR